MLLPIQIMSYPGIKIQELNMKQLEQVLHPVNKEPTLLCIQLL